MPRRARHGGNRAKPDSMPLGIGHGECHRSTGTVWEQGFWKLSSDPSKERTGGPAQDQMTSLFQLRTFVKIVLHSLFFLLDPSRLGFLLLYPTPSDCSVLKRMGWVVGLGNWKQLSLGPAVFSKARAIHWKHTALACLNPLFGTHCNLPTVLA